jgi:hypothetical protein
MPYSEGAMGSRNSNTGAGRRTKLGMALERSAEEILAHVKGDAKLPTRRVMLPDRVVDVKRKSLAGSIRRHIEPLGGVELTFPTREAVRRPSKIGK